MQEDWLIQHDGYNILNFGKTLDIYVDVFWYNFNFCKPCLVTDFNFQQCFWVVWRFKMLYPVCTHTLDAAGVNTVLIHLIFFFGLILCFWIKNGSKTHIKNLCYLLFYVFHLISFEDTDATEGYSKENISKCRV